MDMYQKRKMRKEKREQNEEQNQNGTRTCISWEICIYANTPLKPYK